MSALETMMPPVQFAEINGQRLAYYEAGPRRSVPIILCHGFPELAFSWRRQIKALSDAGRWGIAPDQRGYGLSRPPGWGVADGLDHTSRALAGLLGQSGW